MALSSGGAKRKYDDGSAIFGGMPPLHMCCFSLIVLNFNLHANDME